MLLVGPISHNSIQLLIATTNFVALSYFTGYVFVIYALLPAGVESGDQFFLDSEVLSCFSGVMLSIGSSLLFPPLVRSYLLFKLVWSNDLGKVARELEVKCAFYLICIITYEKKLAGSSFSSQVSLV